MYRLHKEERNSTSSVTCSMRIGTYVYLSLRRSEKTCYFCHNEGIHIYRYPLSDDGFIIADDVRDVKHFAPIG